MEMLDASLAFALTLAALSTVVTIILEACHRLLRIRKWNLILTMKKLTAEIAADGVIDGRGCWDFVVKVLNNGTHPQTQKLLPADDLEKTKPVKQGLFPLLWNNVFTFSYGDLHLPGKRNDNVGSVAIKGFKKLVQMPRRLLMGEQPADTGLPEGDYLRTIASLKRCHATRAVFDKVSVEHILRRFVELPEVKAQLEQNRVKVEAELDKISRKYEEFASSVTADFKRRSRMWSIFIGVTLALAVNIDATLIFETYLKDKTLTENVIKNYEKFKKTSDEAQQKLDEATKDADASGRKQAIKQLAEKQKQLDVLNAKEKTDENKKQIAVLKAEIDKLLTRAFANSDAGRAQQAVKEAGMQLHSLSVLGVPLGKSYFPHCMLFNKADVTTAAISEKEAENMGIFSYSYAWIGKWFDPKAPAPVDKNCLTGQMKKPFLFPLLGWLMMVGITGILIGLGAPFWFDVARRIAEVRSMFNGKQDNEQRMAGKDINGDAKDRKELVKNVIMDAVADKKLSDAAKGSA